VRFPLLFALSAAAAQAALVTADGGAYSYQGRIDNRHPTAPVLVWESTRVAVTFKGPVLALRFGPSTGQNYFDLTVDGVTDVIAVPEGAGGVVPYPRPLKNGSHTLVLAKRSEGNCGHATFLGIEDRDGRASPPGARPPAVRRPRYLFFGDSITAGACNEDGPLDQWDSRRTHNSELSYGALAARALRADYQIVAISGIGLVTGYVDPTFGQVWNHLYPAVDSPLADLTAWAPDVVFFNFGENDASHSARLGQPFPADYADRYLELVRQVRAAYPRAEFVLLRGGMGEGATNPDLHRAWDDAVRRIEAQDPRVCHFVFSHWSKQHPRVADDRLMAAELRQWLESRPFPGAPD
jgi:lysophospholipase L1-like esterase